MSARHHHAPEAFVFPDVVPDAPDARFLIQVLRDGVERRHWPEGLVWDYACHGTCAIGLACRLWSKLTQAHFGLACDSGTLGDALGLPFEASYDVFICRPPGCTPTHVANALEAALAQVQP